MESPGNGYDELRNRAFVFMQDANGAVREDALIQFIFGANQRTELWRTLLTNVLGADGRFVQAGGGFWHLGSALPAAEIGISFVALDVETTGLRPDQHRVIEIGMARYANGRCMDRYSALINPERRIPEYIRKLTGITDSDLIPAPPFREFANDIVAFVGEHPIIGHNIGFDMGFINAELKRMDRQPLRNPTIDTIPMAMRVLGRRMRPSLDRVALALGMPSRDVHRALGDAELTAAVALRMLPMAAAQGIEIEAFINRGTRSIIATPPRAGSTTLLDRAHLDTLPRKPGVYVMYDADGRVLYVGKAKSLRDRVSSYYSQPLGYTRKMDGLIEAIHHIEHEETGSELVALLLEAQLIRRHQPPYNRMLRNSETYPYIRLDLASKWPRLRLAKKPGRDGAHYFGPFRSRSTAQDAIKVLSRRFSLRTCARTFKTPSSYGNPCLELDLHRCPGPCVGRADADEYRLAVAQVLDLFTSETPQVFVSIENDLQNAIAAEQFERAQRLRRDLDVLARVHTEQQSLHRIDLQAPYCIIQAAAARDSVQVLLVIQGRWWAQVIEQPAHTERIIERLTQAWDRFCTEGLDPLDHSGVDEANILQRWSLLPAAQPFIVRLEQRKPAWERVIGQIRHLAGGVPSGDVADNNI